MPVKLDVSNIKRTKWHEYAMRFAAGGVITAIVGLIGRKYGPLIAGLFLAFPAIFPASATLVEKRAKKQQKGLDAEQRGLKSAADDASGAAMGSAALFLFALVTYSFVSRYSAGLVLACATAIWFGSAIGVWILHQNLQHWRQFRRSKRIEGATRGRR